MEVFDLTKIDDFSQSYSEIKSHLNADYGGPDPVVSDLLVGLTKKKRPASGNKKERYQFC